MDVQSEWNDAIEAAAKRCDAEALDAAEWAALPATDDEGREHCEQREVAAKTLAVAIRALKRPSAPESERRESDAATGGVWIKRLDRANETCEVCERLVAVTVEGKCRQCIARIFDEGDTRALVHWTEMFRSRDAELSRLKEENERLRARVDELESQARVLAAGFDAGDMPVTGEAVRRLFTVDDAALRAAPESVTVEGGDVRWLI